jgi:hypothetical protein
MNNLFNYLPTSVNKKFYQKMTILLNYLSVFTNEHIYEL